jgi:tetratricopeptide (TPR) repeat protein
LMDGRAAFDRFEWSAAFEAFQRADAEVPLRADDLERAGLSAMWLGEFEPCIEFRQRAFAMRVAEGDVRHAAQLAIELCFDQAGRDRLAVALGWAQRAERLLDGCEPCSALGRLVELRAIVALEIEHDVAAASQHYDEALRIGRLSNDPDVVAAALVGSGSALVRQGRVREGLRLVDEAMVDAVSGLLGPVMTARIYCNTISLCQALGDIRRASEWTEQAVTCSTRPGMGDFPAIVACIEPRSRGSEAIGLVQSPSYVWRWLRSNAGPRVTSDRLGTSSARSSCGRGDLAAAADAFDRAAKNGKDPQPGLAMLRLAHGEEAVASALLRVAVETAGDADPLAVGQLLPAIVEVTPRSGIRFDARSCSPTLSIPPVLLPTWAMKGGRRCCTRTTGRSESCWLITADPR